MASNLSERHWEELIAVAENGLLDRRAFLTSGAALAGGFMSYALARSAAAEMPIAYDLMIIFRDDDPGRIEKRLGENMAFEKIAAA